MSYFDDYYNILEQNMGVSINGDYNIKINVMDILCIMFDEDFILIQCYVKIG